MVRIVILLAFLLPASTCNELKELADSVLTEDGALTNSEIAGGLKQALEQGISKGAQKLSIKDGYFKSAYKILLPEEVQKVTNTLQKIPGFSKVEDEMLKLLNRAAEDAATTAKPIFVEAIKGMSFNDALGILMGEQDAATTFLHKSTYQKLYSAFSPKVNNSLDRVNATEYWNKAITAYNKIPLVEKVNPDLGNYVTEKALTGLFGMVEKEEIGIRQNVNLRTTDLLKKVFAKQDNK